MNLCVFRSSLRQYFLQDGGFAAFAQGLTGFVGLLAIPVVLFSEYTLKQTGSNFTIHIVLSSSCKRVTEMFTTVDLYKIASRSQAFLTSFSLPLMALDRAKIVVDQNLANSRAWICETYIGLRFQLAI